MEIDFNKVYNQQPTNELLSKVVKVITVGGLRCVYLNDRRICGSKPYVSEGLPSKSLETTVREALEAFSIEELQAAIDERKERKAYFKGYHNSKEALLQEKENEERS